ncbi:MAG: hypothetical protein ACXWAV_10980, partial [Chthoniobacterales bacterium]
NPFQRLTRRWLPLAPHRQFSSSAIISLKAAQISPRELRIAAHLLSQETQRDSQEVVSAFAPMRSYFIYENAH